MDENVPLDARARAAIVAHLVAGNEIAAIKVYRRATGAGLADAKEAVETIAQLDGIVVASKRPAVVTAVIVALVLAIAIAVIRYNLAR